MSPHVIVAAGLAAGILLAAPASADNSSTTQVPGGTITTTWVEGGVVESSGLPFVRVRSVNTSPGTARINTKNTWVAICSDGTRVSALPGYWYTAEPHSSGGGMVMFDGDASCTPVALDLGNNIIGPSV